MTKDRTGTPAGAGEQPFEVPPLDHRFAPSSWWSNICRPDDRFKTLVDDRGRHLYGFQPPSDGEEAVYRLSFSQVISVLPLTNAPPTEVTQRLLDPVAPVVETRMVYPHLILKLTSLAAADSNGNRADVITWEIEAIESGVAAALWMVIDGEPTRGLAPGEFSHRIALAPSDERLVKGIRSSAPLRTASAPGYGPAWAFASDPELLANGDRRSGVVVLLLDEGAPFDPDDIDPARLVREELEYWRSLDLAGGFGTVPDPDVAALVEASLRTIAQNREVEDGIPVYKVGPSVYRGHWVLDGLFLTEVGRYAHDPRVDRAVEAMSALTDDGVLREIIPGHLKEPAVAVATQIRHAELTGDLETLAMRWPTIERTLQSLEELLDGDHDGVTPPANGDGGLGGIRSEWTTALWWLIGFSAGRRGAAYLGVDTDPIDRAYTRLLRSVRDQLETDRRLTDRGLPYWPMLRPGSGEHHFRADVSEPVSDWHRANPLTATYALAQAIHPGEIFEPDDRIVTEFLDLLERSDGEESIPAGSGFLPNRSVWTYYAALVAQAALYADRPGQALRYLYGFANHASPTLVWREEQAHQSTGLPLTVGDMPHAWASAEFVRLIRHLVVFERGDELHVLKAVPTAWFDEGDLLELSDTPTRFGPVSVSLRYRPGDWRLEVRVPDRGPARLDRCVVHLPEFAGAEQSITCDGTALDVGTETVELGPGTTVVIERRPR